MVCYNASWSATEQHSSTSTGVDAQFRIQLAPYRAAVEDQRKTVHQNLPLSSPGVCTRQALALTGSHYQRNHYQLSSAAIGQSATEQPLPADSVTAPQQSASPSSYNAPWSATEQHPCISTCVDAQSRGDSPPPPEHWQPDPEPSQVRHPTSQAHLWRVFEGLVYEFWSGEAEVVFTSPGTGGWYPPTPRMTWRGEVETNDQIMYLARMDFWRGTPACDLFNSAWCECAAHMTKICSNENYLGGHSDKRRSQWMEATVGAVFALATDSIYMKWSEPKGASPPGPEGRRLKVEVTPVHLHPHKCILARTMWKVLQDIGLRCDVPLPRTQQQPPQMQPPPQSPTQHPLPHAPALEVAPTTSNRAPSNVPVPAQSQNTVLGEAQMQCFDNHADSEQLREYAEGSAAADAKEVAEPALGSATERTRSEDGKQQRLAYKRLARAILNEFIGNATFENADVDDMLRAALDAESQWDTDMQTRITDVFEPIFFEFTNGLADRTRLKPRDARAYINKWRDLAALRDEVIPNANDRLIHFSGTQVTRVRDLYYGRFLTTARPDQDKRRLRSCFASRLKTEAGSSFVAHAIWEIGLPRLPSFATEQRQTQLSASEATSRSQQTQD